MSNFIPPTFFMFNIGSYYLKGEIPIFDFKGFSKPEPILVSSWLEKFNQHPLFKEYDVFLCGSYVQPNQTPNDLDIIVTGSFDRPELIKRYFVEVLTPAYQDFRLPVDMLFYPDVSWFKNPVHKSFQKKYECYTYYNYELWVEEGKVVKSRYFRNNKQIGGLTQHLSVQPSNKSIEKKYVPTFIKIGT